MGASAFAHGAYLCREDPSWHQLLKNAINAGISICQFASYVARVPVDQNLAFCLQRGLCRQRGGANDPGTQQRKRTL
jgi:hypothetical protein